MDGAVSTQGLSTPTAAAKSSHGKRKLSQTTSDDFDSDDSHLNPTHRQPNRMNEHRTRKVRQRQDKALEASTDAQSINLTGNKVTSSKQGLQQSDPASTSSDAPAVIPRTNHNQSQGPHAGNADIISISSDEDERLVIKKTPAQTTATNVLDQTLQNQHQAAVLPQADSQASQNVALSTYTCKYYATPGEIMGLPDHLIQSQAALAPTPSDYQYIGARIIQMDDANVPDQIRRMQQAQLAASSASQRQLSGVTQMSGLAATSQGIVPASTNAASTPVPTAPATQPVPAVDSAEPPAYLSCYEVCSEWPNSLCGKGLDAFLQHRFTAAQIFLCLPDQAKNRYRLSLPANILATLQRFLSQRKLALERAQTYDALMTGPEIRRDGRWDGLKMRKVPLRIIDGTDPAPLCPDGFIWRTTPPATAGSTATIPTDAPDQNGSDSVDVGEAGPVGESVAAHVDRNEFLMNEVEGLRGDFEDMEAKHKAKIQELEAEVDRVGCELEGETNGRLDAEMELGKVKVELEEAKVELEEAKVELEEAKVELGKLKE